MKPWLVLVNPRAGRGAFSAARVESILDQYVIDHDIVEVGDRNALREMVAQAAREGRDRFAAVGGSGTMNSVANAILEHSWDSPPTLGMLPTGSSCDVLRTFGIPVSLQKATAHLQGDQTYPIDVGTAMGEWGRHFFVNAVSLGMLAEVVRTAKKMTPRWRSARYTAAFVKTMPRFRPETVSVDLGAKRFDGSSLGMLVANGQFMGAGFNVAPRASMMDGKFDVQVFTTRRWDLPSLMAKARKGNHLTDPNVKRFLAAEVRIDSQGKPWRVEADGEVLGNTPVVIRAQQGLLSLKI